MAHRGALTGSVKGFWKNIFLLLSVFSNHFQALWCRGEGVLKDACVVWSYLNGFCSRAGLAADCLEVRSRVTLKHGGMCGCQQLDRFWNLILSCTLDNF